MKNYDEIKKEEEKSSWEILANSVGVAHLDWRKKISAGYRSMFTADSEAARTISRLNMVPGTTPYKIRNVGKLFRVANEELIPNQDGVLNMRLAKAPSRVGWIAVQYLMKFGRNISKKCDNTSCFAGAAEHGFDRSPSTHGSPEHQAASQRQI